MATFFNQATLTYNNTTTLSNVVTGEIVGVLLAEKTAVSPSYTAGGDVAYVISIINSGTTPYTDLTVTDDLGTYESGGLTLTPLSYKEGSVKYYVNGILLEAPTVVSLSPLTFTGISVPAGGNAIIVYEADVNRFAPLGADASITNTANVSGSGLTNPVTAIETIGTVIGPVLSITKELSPVLVPENGVITYTFTIRNTGNEAIVATDNAVITDAFDPTLDITSVTYNGTAWVEGVNYDYDEITGIFTTREGQITVPAATFTQDPATGEWVVTPGTATIVVVGTV
jgi:uncharacterized repeat protein (TIGR01451 family)